MYIPICTYSELCGVVGDCPAQQEGRVRSRQANVSSPSSNQLGRLGTTIGTLEILTPLKIYLKS